MAYPTDNDYHRMGNAYPRDVTMRDRKWMPENNWRTKVRKHAADVLGFLCIVLIVAFVLFLGAL